MNTTDRTFRDGPTDRFCATAAAERGVQNPTEISVVSFGNGMVAAAVPAAFMHSYVDTLPRGWDTVTCVMAMPAVRMMVIVTDFRQ